MISGRVNSPGENEIGFSGDSITSNFFHRNLPCIGDVLHSMSKRIIVKETPHTQSLGIGTLSGYVERHFEDDTASVCVYDLDGMPRGPYRLHIEYIRLLPGARGMMCVCKEQGINLEWTCPAHGLRWRKSPDDVTRPLEEIKTFKREEKE